MLRQPCVACVRENIEQKTRTHFRMTKRRSAGGASHQQDPLSALILASDGGGGGGKTGTGAVVPSSSQFNVGAAAAAATASSSSSGAAASGSSLTNAQHQVLDDQLKRSLFAQNALRVRDFVCVRQREIGHMMRILAQKQVSSAHNRARIFQRLPRHMRRRAMSHNIHLLPKYLRALAHKEMQVRTLRSSAQ